MTQSTTYTTSFQVLGDARILFRPDKWPNAYSWNGGRYTVKYTINVREDVRLGFDKSILDPFPYTRIATVVPDSSHPPYQYWVRIQLEDGRTVVPNTVDEARSLMFDVNKSYKVNGATLGTGTHKLFSRVEAQWSGYLFSGSDKKDKDAPRVTVTVTK
jgi:hypothetical protein